MIFLFGRCCCDCPFETRMCEVVCRRYFYFSYVSCRFLVFVTTLCAERLCIPCNKS